MSGWENIPEEALAPRKAGAGAADELDATGFEDGQLAQLVDTYWPQVWLAMLAIVSVIGIWAAIGKLPNVPSWWP